MYRLLTNSCLWFCIGSDSIELVVPTHELLFCSIRTRPDASLDDLSIILKTLFLTPLLTEKIREQEIWASWRIHQLLRA